MSTQTYELLRVVGGRTYFARITIDVDVSSEAFAWLNDVFAPDWFTGALGRHGGED
jgi:hypothetical protein